MCFDQHGRVDTSSHKTESALKSKLYLQGKKGQSEASMLAVKPHPGMFFMTHPWPF